MASGANISNKELLKPVNTDTNSTSSNGSLREIEQPPSWLNKTLLETALKRKYGCSLNVIGIEIKPAVKYGENYMCVVHRCAVQTRSQGVINVIAKCIPTNENRNKLLRELEFMSREIDVYKNVLHLLKGSHEKPNTPHCYFADMDDDYGVLLFQDLSTEGFRIRHRQLGLDKQHCVLAISELAHFHGASIALRLKNPSVFKSVILNNYEDTVFRDEKRERFEKYMESVLLGLAEAVRLRLSYRFHGIANVMEKMSLNSYDEIGALVRSGFPKSDSEFEGKIFVLTHGDFWSNNIMFKYTDTTNEPEACTMLDFQIARIATPVLDLLYMLLSSTEQSVRNENMDLLLQLYLDECQNAMLARGVIDLESCPFYHSVEEIKDDMKANALFGFYMACLIMPIVVTNTEDAPTFDDLTEEKMRNMTVQSNPSLQMFKGPLFCNRFREILEDYDNLGLFANYEKNLTNSDCGKLTPEQLTHLC